MKIVCVIDSLGSGGAQRQLVNLACGLKAKGHDVEFLIYFPHLNFFRHALDQHGIRVNEIRKGKGFSFRVPVQLATLIRTRRVEAVISFLTVPNAYCELCRCIAPRHQLVVSERSSKAGDLPLAKSLALRMLHILADHVVANSESHANWLRTWPWLRNRTSAIYNGYAISEPRPKTPPPAAKLRLLVVGRVHSGKNGLRLIEAVDMFLRRHGTCPDVSWAGRRESDHESVTYIEEMERALARCAEVRAHWHWLGARADVPHLLSTHDALIHPSLYEGLPNVVCESLIAGCPVIVSDVCDHALLVPEGVRGFLCDPNSADSICAAIERFAALTDDEREQMSNNARGYAETNLSLERMVNAYEKLLLDSSLDHASQ